MGAQEVRDALTDLLTHVGSVTSGAECDEARLPLGFPQRLWTARGEGDYVGAWFAPKRFAVCVERQLDQLRERAEFKSALDAIESDQRLAGYEGKTFGTPQSSGAFVRHDFLIHVCVDGAQRFGKNLASEARPLAERIVSALFADTVAYELMAPLPRFKCAGLPIALADDVRIDRLSERDLEYAIEQRLVEVQPHPPPSMEFGSDGNRVLNDEARYEWAYVPQSAAVYTRFELPLSTGPYSKAQIDSAAKVRTDAEGKLTALISALRAFKDGYVWFPGAVLRADSWWLEGAVSIGWSERVPRGEYRLNMDETAQFAEFWGNLRDPKCRSTAWLGTAIRRFGFSSDRSRTEDRLVDSMIAFESLFLHDATDELSYRLGIRSSSYLEEAGDERRALYKKFRESYNARSAVVHGSNPKAGGFASLEEMVEFLEGTFRKTVRRLATEIAGGAKPGDDWESFVLDISPRLTQ